MAEQVLASPIPWSSSVQACFATPIDARRGALPARFANWQRRAMERNIKGN